MKQVTIPLLLAYAFLIVQAKTYFPGNQISAVLVKFSTPTQITIHIIDPLTKLAVFEYANQDGFCYYKLCIPVVNASNFDLIVNHCEEIRQTEFEFDTIDYAQLLGIPNTKVTTAI